MRWVRGPPETRVRAGVATATVTVSGSARGKVTRGRPAEDADEGAWRAFMVARLDDLDRDVEQVQRQAEEDRAAAEAAVEEVRDELRGVEARLTSRVTAAVGGPEGGGIDKQFWGLTLVLAGSALAVLGGLL